MDNRETSTPSSDDPILKRHLFSGVTIKGRGDVGRVYFVRRPSRQSFGFRVAASSGPILKAPGSAGGYLQQPRLPQLPDAPLIVDPAHGLFAPPRSTFALDCKQVVGRGWIAAMCDRGCRRHPDRGNRTVRSVDPY